MASTTPSSSRYYPNARGSDGGALINYEGKDDVHTRVRGVMNFYTQSGNSSRGGEEASDLPPPASSSTLYDNDLDSPNNNNTRGIELDNQAAICSDIDAIKVLLLKQTEKMKALELAMDQREAALSVSSKQDLIQDRIDRVEVDVQGCSKHLQSISQEASELGVQAKASNGRLAWVEDMYRTSSQEYVTKTTFAQLLTSCMDQLKDMNTVAENARTKGGQAMHFVESFLAAISNLQSSQPSFSLEVLIGLSG